MLQATRRQFTSSRRALQLVSSSPSKRYNHGRANNPRTRLDIQTRNPSHSTKSRELHHATEKWATTAGALYVFFAVGSIVYTTSLVLCWKLELGVPPLGYEKKYNYFIAGVVPAIPISVLTFPYAYKVFGSYIKNVRSGCLGGLFLGCAWVPINLAYQLLPIH